MTSRVRPSIPLSLLTVVLIAAAAAGTEAQTARLGIAAGPGAGLVAQIDAVRIAGEGRLADSDSDGIADSQDNCTNVANPAQRDTDSDNIGNLCDPDIAVPNDCNINFLDLNVMKLAFFSNSASPNWNADSDLNGDDAVNFADLQTVMASFFSRPGPSGLLNACTQLDEGDVCDPGASLCGAGLTCCYPCGIPDCEFICEVTCAPGDPACMDGCYLRP